MTPSTLEQKAKQTAKLLSLSEEVVDAVIRWQWKSVYDNMSSTSSIEVSGLGKFKIRMGKVNRRIELLEKFISSYLSRLESLEEGDIKRTTLIKKLESATSEIEYLKTKTNGL